MFSSNDPMLSTGFRVIYWVFQKAVGSFTAKKPAIGKEPRVRRRNRGPDATDEYLGPFRIGELDENLVRIFLAERFATVD